MTSFTIPFPANPYSPGPKLMTVADEVLANWDAFLEYQRSKYLWFLHSNKEYCGPDCRICEAEFREANGLKQLKDPAVGCCGSPHTHRRQCG